MKLTGAAILVSRETPHLQRLRRHAEDRLRYEALKRKLAKEDWPDRNAYARAKGQVVEEIIARALHENSNVA